VTRQSPPSGGIACPFCAERHRTADVFCDTYGLPLDQAGQAERLPRKFRGLSSVTPGARRGEAGRFLLLVAGLVERTFGLSGEVDREVHVDRKAQQVWLDIPIAAGGRFHVRIQVVVTADGWVGCGLAWLPTQRDALDEADLQGLRLHLQEASQGEWAIADIAAPWGGEEPGRVLDEPNLRVAEARGLVLRTQWQRGDVALLDRSQYEKLDLALAALPHLLVLPKVEAGETPELHPVLGEDTDVEIAFRNLGRTALHVELPPVLPAPWIKQWELGSQQVAPGEEGVLRLRIRCDEETDAEASVVVVSNAENPAGLAWRVEVRPRRLSLTVLDRAVKFEYVTRRSRLRPRSVRVTVDDDGETPVDLEWDAPAKAAAWLTVQRSDTPGVLTFSASPAKLPRAQPDANALVRVKAAGRSCRPCHVSVTLCPNVAVRRMLSGGVLFLAVILLGVVLFWLALREPGGTQPPVPDEAMRVPPVTRSGLPMEPTPGGRGSARRASPRASSRQGRPSPGGADGALGSGGVSSVPGSAAPPAEAQPRQTPPQATPRRRTRRPRPARQESTPVQRPSLEPQPPAALGPLPQ